MKADKMFEKLGFEKLMEDKTRIKYSRKVGNIHNHIIEILPLLEFKETPIIFSYQLSNNEETIGDYKNIGVDYLELKAIYKKVKELRKKHKKGE